MRMSFLFLPVLFPADPMINVDATVVAVVVVVVLIIPCAVLVTRSVVVLVSCSTVDLGRGEENVADI